MLDWPRQDDGQSLGTGHEPLDPQNRTLTRLPMSRPTRTLPTPDEERDLHRRLLERDPVASSELADAYMDHLVAWLKQGNSRSIDEHVLVEAAGDALISLIKQPESYRDNTSKSLVAYLQMSASGDLKNLLAKHNRRAARTVSLESVELLADAGNELATTDDPSDQLIGREDAERIRQDILPTLREGLTTGELVCLNLLLARERRTEPYADALGIGNLEIDEQRRLVKQVKDKLQRRITRGRSRHDEPS